MLLDDFMPAYDINDAHSIIINASPGRIYRSLTEITAGELSPLVSMLFAIRDLPERLVGRTPSLRFNHLLAGYLPGKRTDSKDVA